MCGRYTLRTDRHLLEKRFGVEDIPLFSPRYNLAPTQDGLVVRPGHTPGERTAAWLRWGLIPPWTKPGTSGPLLINARSETAAGKPAFRDAFRKRRCLVLADGFYEWTRAGPERIPHHFTVDQGEPFAMAGLWERWHPPGAEKDEVVETYTILTTAANDVVAPHHDRMPLILEPDLYEDWINPRLQDADAVKRMLKPIAAIHLGAHRVSNRVNKTQHDDPACLEPPETENDRGAGGEAGGGQLEMGLG